MQRPLLKRGATRRSARTMGGKAKKGRDEAEGEEEEREGEEEEESVGARAI